MIGFQGEVPRVLWGAFMCQLPPQHSFHFQSLGWFYTLFLCKGIRISGSFVRKGERERSNSFELHTLGQPRRQSSKL